MAPLMISVTTALVARGHAVLRFNFRGTGESGGRHDYGGDEQLDIDAAIGHAGERYESLRIAGWSFGAATALNWLASRGKNMAYAGIAPPSERLPAELPAGPKRLIIGTRDQLVDVDALRTYAEAQSIDLVITPGDHFFHGRGSKIGALVAQAF